MSGVCGELDRATDGLTTELEQVREEMVGVTMSLAELGKGSKGQDRVSSSITQRGKQARDAAR